MRERGVGKGWLYLSGLIVARGSFCCFVGKAWSHGWSRLSRNFCLSLCSVMCGNSGQWYGRP